MKTKTSLIALVTVLSLGTANVAWAQVSTDTDADAGVDAEVDASAGDTDVGADVSVGADADVDAGDEGADVDAGVGADAGAGADTGSDDDGVATDANADDGADADDVGTEDDDDAASGGSLVGTGDDDDETDDSMSGDGEDGAMAGDAATEMESQSCDDVGLESMIDASSGLDPAMISAASTAQIVVVADCAEADISSALSSTGATQVQGAIDSNDMVLQDLQARGLTTADVLGATMQGDVLVIYASGDGSLASD